MIRKSNHIIAGNIRVAFVLLLLNFLAVNISAQPQHRTVETRLKEYFRTYQSPEVEIGTCKLVRFQLNAKKRTLAVYANTNFGHQPFRPQTTEKIYADLRKRLPGPVNYYNITIFVGDKSIDDLIPNIYRKTKDNTRLWGRNTHRGHAWVSNLSRPYSISEGLQGRHLAITPSHGKYYKNDEARWKWQRPSLYATREDLLSQSIVVPYLIPMLENAGAVVFSARERDRNPYDIIIDNDANSSDCGLYIEEKRRKAHWEDGKLGFAIPEGVLQHDENPFHNGTSRIIRTANHEKNTESAALWIPSIPERGYYAVYVSYQSYPSSVPDAEYLVLHAGGTTRISVNQQMGGGTWVYLGTFEFKSGQYDNQMVILTNRSSFTGVVSADAIRFGGGSSRIDRASTDTIHTSGLPRYYEGARYQSQWAGFPTKCYACYQGEKDYAEDINSRSLVTNHLLGGSIYCPDSIGLRVPIELVLGLHTDAGIREDDTTIGTLGIYTTEHNNSRLASDMLSRYTSRDLTDIVQTYISHDINHNSTITSITNQEGKVIPPFTRRSMWNRNYSESRLPEVPSCIIELLSHQNFADMRYAHDPHFKFIASRAIYKGILRYTAEMHATSYTVQPLPVQSFAIDFAGSNKIRLSWHPTKDDLEPSATPEGYILYTRTDSMGWDNGQRLGHTSCEITLHPDHMYSFRVTAYNPGGESFPSETLSAHIATQPKGKVLVVNGFQRIDGPAVVNTSELAGFDLATDPGVPYIGTTAFSGLQHEFRRSLAGYYNEAEQLGATGEELDATYMAGNTMDYASVHGSSIKHCGYSFVSCSRQAFESGKIKPDNFDVVDIYMGLQRERNDAIVHRPTYYNVTPAMYTLLSNYTRQGGALLVSGSYIGEESQHSAVTQALLSDILHAHYSGSITQWDEQGIYGLGTTLEIPRWINPEQYPVTHPEIVTPTGSAFTPLVYEHSRHSAAVAYNGAYRSALLGFPFEAIRSQYDRDLVMHSLLNFLTGKQ